MPRVEEEMSDDTISFELGVGGLGLRWWRVGEGKCVPEVVESVPPQEGGEGVQDPPAPRHQPARVVTCHQCTPQPIVQ